MEAQGSQANALEDTVLLLDSGEADAWVDLSQFDTDLTEDDAPYEDPSARGAITGATGRELYVRAIVEPSDTDGVLLAHADPSSIAAGWVVSRDFDCVGERVLLRVILNAETDFVMYAPACVATRYDEDEEDEGYRLAVEDDWLGFRNGESFDCQGFEEPSWSIEGGDANIEIFQFDGVTWTRGIYGVVSSVTAATGNCWSSPPWSRTRAIWCGRSS